MRSGSFLNTVSASRRYSSSIFSNGIPSWMAMARMPPVDVPHTTSKRSWTRRPVRSSSCFSISIVSSARVPPPSIESTRTRRGADSADACIAVSSEPNDE